MKDFFGIDYRAAVRKVVKAELKESFGIKIPKSRENKSHRNQDPDEHEGALFRVPLRNVPTKSMRDDCYYKVPSFLVDAFEFLTPHLKLEGLFRKSGSVGRQKALKEMLEQGASCSECEMALPHDVAALVKQFFRELPDPLLTQELSNVFLKCIHLSNTEDMISSMALVCLLLPDEHLMTLQYFVKFITEVANHSLESKMTFNNLAIVFSPNLMNVVAKEKSTDKNVKERTQVVDLLFKNSHLIGMVPDPLLNKAATLSTEMDGFISSSGDELQTEQEANQGRGRKARSVTRGGDKKRERSHSITGFVSGLRRNLKNSTTPVRHNRSNSEQPDSPTVSRKDGLTKQNSGGSITEHRVITRNFSRSSGKPPTSQKKTMASLKRAPSSVKRTPSVKRNSTVTSTGISPVRKSPRLEQDRYEITGPQIVSLPNQLFSTGQKLIPVAGSHHNNQIKYADLTDRLKALNPSGKALPSKFEFNQHRQLPMTPLSHSEYYTSKSVATFETATTTTRDLLSGSTSSDHNNPMSDPHNTSNIMDISMNSTLNSTLDQPPLLVDRLPNITPNISRQKPVIRKNSKDQSADKRRARYARARTSRRQLPCTPHEDYEGDENAESEITTHITKTVTVSESFQSSAPLTPSKAHTRWTLSPSSPNAPTQVEKKNHKRTEILKTIATKDLKSNAKVLKSDVDTPTKIPVLVSNHHKAAGVFQRSPSTKKVVTSFRSSVQAVKIVNSSSKENRARLSPAPLQEKPLEVEFI